MCRSERPCCALALCLTGDSAARKEQVHSLVELEGRRLQRSCSQLARNSTKCTVPCVTAHSLICRFLAIRNFNFGCTATQECGTKPACRWHAWRYISPSLLPVTAANSASSSSRLPRLAAIVLRECSPCMSQRSME